MARFTSGWIKIYRTILEKEEFVNNPEMLGIWVNLLLMANYKETKKDWGGTIRLLPPGTILLGIKDLSARWKLSRDTILRRLRYLEKWGCIRVETAEQGTVVTICNWNEYQFGEENVAELLRDSCVTPASLLRDSPTHSKEVKKERRKERKKKTLAGIHSDYPPIFVQFWDTYGKVGSKSQAFKTFEKLKLTESDHEVLSQAIKNYFSRKPEWQSPQHFSTFLNSDWKQYLEEPGQDPDLAEIFDFLPHRQKQGGKNE